MRLIFTFLSLMAFIASYNATTFTSIVNNGVWSTSTTWNRTGTVDADGIPDADDTVIIANTFNVRLSAAIAYSKNLTISTGGTLTCNSKKLFMYGNFTNNGTVAGTLNFYAISDHMIFSSLNPYVNSGDMWIQKTCTIAAGTVINKVGPITIQSNNKGVVNYGTVTLTNNGSIKGTVRFSNSGNFWKNEAGSTLKVSSNIIKPFVNNILNCTTVTNLVEYTGTCTDIFYTTYNNLSITGTSTKTLTTAFIVNGNLALSGPATNSIIANADITVRGNFTNNVLINFVNHSKKIIFNGSSATPQAIGGVTNTQFYDLEVNNTGGGVVFNTNQSVNHDLIMIRGNCNSGSSRLILISNASTTARIAAIATPSNVSFSGSMRMQKFYPAVSAIPQYSLAYHDLSSPAQATTVSDWDNELYISGIGPYDGQGGPVGVDGDVYNGAPSMHTYAAASGSFVPVTGSTTTLTPGVGYNLLLLDDWDALTGVGSWNAKTIDTRGIPNFGSVSVPVRLGSATGIWNLLGNPYASPITFSTGVTVSSGAIGANIYFYENGNYQNYPRNVTVIPPHQGFYMFKTGGTTTANIVFTEACKVVNYTTVYHKLTPNYDIKLNLSSNSAGFYHQNDINFNSEASVNFDEDFDAVYKESPRPVAPAIYMLDAKNDIPMINNSIDSKADELTIPLGIFTPKAGIYNLDASVLNMDSYTYIWIENVKTGVKYDLNHSVAIECTELGTNSDYVLRLSKTKQNSSISEAILETDLLIFSTENTINLKSSYTDHNIKELLVYDMTGKLILSEKNINVIAGNISKTDITFLSGGIYVVKVIDQEGRATSKKIVK